MSAIQNMGTDKRKTIVKGMRWGYDGGGLGCGPIPGSHNVELMVMDEKGHLYFILDSMFECYEKVVVSPMPIFDISMEMVRYGVDFDHEYDKLLDHYMEEYDYEVTEVPEEMSESRFAKAMQMARIAMQTALNMDHYPRPEEAAAFIDTFLDEDLELLDLPEVTYEDDEDLDE